MERTNRGLSRLKLMIIGILLVGVVIGGVQLVRSYTTQPPAVQPSDQPVVEAPVEEALAEQTTPSPAVAELPTTGPKETIVSVLVLGLLAAAVTSYVRSRRPGLSL